MTCNKETLSLCQQNVKKGKLLYDRYLSKIAAQEF